MRSPLFLRTIGTTPDLRHTDVPRQSLHAATALAWVGETSMMNSPPRDKKREGGMTPNLWCADRPLLAIGIRRIRRGVQGRAGRDPCGAPRHRRNSLGGQDPSSTIAHSWRKGALDHSDI